MHDSRTSLPELQHALAGRYVLERRLGRGGMGIVYLARELRLDRQVAIKLLPPAKGLDPVARQRFLHEARTAARFSHPNIVPIFAVDEIEELVFFAMAYVEGHTLGQRIREGGPLGPEEGARVLQEVARALAYAHARGVVHRDVKPDNIRSAWWGSMRSPVVCRSKRRTATSYWRVTSRSYPRRSGRWLPMRRAGLRK